MFNTPWGKYRYTHLPFGIKMAGDIFIEEMNKILKDLPGMNIIADVSLIYGRTKEERYVRLEAVLKKAREVHLKLNPSKFIRVSKTIKNNVK